MAIEPPPDEEVPPTRLGQQHVLHEPRPIRLRPVDHLKLPPAQYRSRFITVVVRDVAGVGYTDRRGCEGVEAGAHPEAHLAARARGPGHSPAAFLSWESSGRFRDLLGGWLHERRLRGR